MKCTILSRNLINSLLIAGISGFIFSCSPSEIIDETSTQVLEAQQEQQQNSQSEKEVVASSEKFIYKGKQITQAEFDALGDNVISIVGMQDSSSTQYVFANRKEALVWLEQFGERSKELSKGLVVSGILANFAEKNNIEAKFDATGEIPKEYSDFERETYLAYYGTDFSTSGMRTEGMGVIHDGCNYDGNSGWVPGPRAVLWTLDKKVSSYQIVYVTWLAFHDRMFFRGKALVFASPFPPNYQLSFCTYYTSWNNRARSISTFVAL